MLCAARLVLTGEVCSRPADQQMFCYSYSCLALGKQRRSEPAAACARRPAGRPPSFRATLLLA
eukprot:7465631-Pyramimonas_sp.AAC.1